MKRLLMPSACMIGLTLLMTACGGSDDAKTSKSGESESAPTKTAEEKLVGKWQAIVSFDNDKFDEARDKLASDAERDQLDAFVEKLMGSTMDMEFTEDKKASSTKPGDSSRVASGTWDIADDKNDTAMVTVKLTTRGGEETIMLDVAFKDDDNFTAPFDPAPHAKGFFYLDVVRVEGGA